MLFEVGDGFLSLIVADEVFHDSAEGIADCILGGLEIDYREA